MVRDVGWRKVLQGRWFAMEVGGGWSEGGDVRQTENCGERRLLLESFVGRECFQGDANENIGVRFAAAQPSGSALAARAAIPTQAFVIEAGMPGQTVFGSGMMPVDYSTKLMTMTLPDSHESCAIIPTGTGAFP